MFFKKRCKRADVTHDLFFKVFWILLAVYIFYQLVSYVNDVAEDTYFDKLYYSRDMALLINTLYASPGNVVLTYANLPYDLVFQFKPSRVVVDDDKKLGEVGYPFAENLDMEFGYAILDPVLPGVSKLVLASADKPGNIKKISSQIFECWELLAKNNENTLCSEVDVSGIGEITIKQKDIEAMLGQMSGEYKIKTEFNILEITSATKIFYICGQKGLVTNEVLITIDLDECSVDQAQLKFSKTGSIIGVTDPYYYPDLNQLQCPDIEITEQMNQQVLLLDPGHGNTDQGIVVDSTSESDFARWVAMSLQANVDFKSIQHTRDLSEGRERKDSIVIQGLVDRSDVIISIHAGTNPDESVNSVEAFVSLDPKSSKLACSIINELLGNQDLKLTGASIAVVDAKDIEEDDPMMVLKEDKVAVLLEIGNMQSTIGREMLQKPASIAESIAEGVKDYYGN